MSKKSWLEKATTTAASKGKYALFKGRAYPRVLAGQNPTKEVKASIHDPQQFYRDPAVKLSDADLNDIDGAEGAPICLEHKKNKQYGDKVFGKVNHSWIDDENGRALNIWGRIEMDADGEKIVEEIKTGKIKGLSVGYTNSVSGGGAGGTAKLDSKTFHEISLVYEPFFEDCNLTVGVFASADSQGNLGNNLTHLQNISPISDSFQEQQVFVPIEIVNMESTSAAAPSTTPAPAAQQQQQQQQAPSGSIMPQPNKEAEDILRQADQLKMQVAERDKELARLKAIEDRYNKSEATAAEEYKKAQEPKYKEYMANWSKTLGKELDEDTQKQYYAAFTDRQWKGDAEKLWSKHQAEMQQHTQREVEVTASKKAAEEAAQRAKHLEEELAATKATLAKASLQMGGMRASYAQVLEPELTPAQSEAADSSRKLVGVNASRNSLNLNEIMSPAPHSNELGWLKTYGYSNEVNVNASANAGPDEPRMFRQSVAAPREHEQLFDHEKREYLLPASMRYIAPGFFSHLVNCGAMRQDLSEFTNVRAYTVDEKRVDDWKHATRAVSMTDK